MGTTGGGNWGNPLGPHCAATRPFGKVQPTGSTPQGAPHQLIHHILTAVSCIRFALHCNEVREVNGSASVRSERRKANAAPKPLE